MLMAFQRSLIRGLLLTLVLTLTAGALFFFVYLPRVHTSQELSNALERTWSRIRSVNSQHQGRLGLRPDRIQASLNQAQSAMTNFLAASRTIQERFRLAPAFEQKLTNDFQLTVFEEKRFQLIGEINQLAADHGVRLAFSPTQKFPVHSAGVDQPALLWAQLSLVYDILSLAIVNRFDTIEEVELLATRPHGSPGGQRVDWHEFPIHLQLIGTANQGLRFLNSLPLTHQELAAHDLPTTGPNKPTLLIDRIAMKRHSNQPEEISLEVVVSGFIKQDWTLPYTNGSN